MHRLRATSSNNTSRAYLTRKLGLSPPSMRVDIWSSTKTVSSPRTARSGRAVQAAARLSGTLSLLRCEADEIGEAHVQKFILTSQVVRIYLVAVRTRSGPEPLFRATSIQVPRRAQKARLFECLRAFEPCYHRSIWRGLCIELLAISRSDSDNSVCIQNRSHVTGAPFKRWKPPAQTVIKTERIHADGFRVCYRFICLDPSINQKLVEQP